MTAFQAPEGFEEIDPQLYKKTLQVGEGVKPDRKGATVTVHYTGRLYETQQVFDSSRDREAFTFQIGQGQVIKGWDFGLATMRVGDRAELLILPEYGYGPQGSPPKIPGNSVLCFDVELLDIDFSTAELTLEEKVQSSTESKDRGNALFKNGQWQEACDAYTAGTKFLSNTWGAEGSDADVVQQLNISLHSNLAATHLKLGNAEKAAEAAQKVLDWDPSHPKALYRLSQAKLAMQEFDQALEILHNGRETLGIDVDKEITKVQQRKKQYHAAEKQMYSKMFA